MFGPVMLSLLLFVVMNVVIMVLFGVCKGLFVVRNSATARRFLVTHDLPACAVLHSLTSARYYARSAQE
jgi:hypothetical protein